MTGQPSEPLREQQLVKFARERGYEKGRSGIVSQLADALEAALARVEELKRENKRLRVGLGSERLYGQEQWHRAEMAESNLRQALARVEELKRENKRLREQVLVQKRERSRAAGEKRHALDQVQQMEADLKAELEKAWDNGWAQGRRHDYIRSVMDRLAREALSSSPAEGTEE